MRKRLSQLAKHIEQAKKAPFHKKAKFVEEAAQTAALLSADLVRGYEELSARLDALEAAAEGGA